jgi:hypothetical protein
MEILSGVSHPVMRLVFVPAALAHRAGGYLPKTQVVKREALNF